LGFISGPTQTQLSGPILHYNFALWARYFSKTILPMKVWSGHPKEEQKTQTCKQEYASVFDK
jgi:hypothetical protein